MCVCVFMYVCMCVKQVLALHLTFEKKGSLHSSTASLCFVPSETTQLIAGKREDRDMRMEAIGAMHPGIEARQSLA